MKALMDLDREMIEWLDKAVENLWAYLGIRRRWILNGVYITAFTCDLIDSLLQDKIKWVLWFAYGFMGLVRFTDHLREKSEDPALYNAVKYVYRYSWFRPFRMCGYVTIVVFLMAGILISDIGCFATVFIWTGLILGDTLVPMGPRKKIKWPKLSLGAPPELSPVRVGA